MYWEIDWETVPGGEMPAGAARFVVHRHHDGEGPHWDLRLEEEGFLSGWRIEAEGGAMGESGAAWAAEKDPHPLSWLEDSRDAVLEDAGRYAWESRGAAEASLVLHGQGGTRRVRARRMRGLPAGAMASVRRVLDAHGVADQALAGLVQDGIEARQRALARFCGLGRELDGDGFDEALWRKTLAPLSLREIQEHLQRHEERFDAKYPPEPTSRPEALAEERDDGDAARIRGILAGS